MLVGGGEDFLGVGGTIKVSSASSLSLPLGFVFNGVNPEIPAIFLLPSDSSPSSCDFFEKCMILVRKRTNVGQKYEPRSKARN
jgi:hypothetical protein